MRNDSLQCLTTLAALAALLTGATASAGDPRDDRDHWAFQVPARPAIPTVAHPAWVLNPIDNFIAQEHDRLGLKPQPPATKAALLRRVFLDLVGLPPTRQQLHEFLADDSPDAYERQVNRLLESPQYGERWARHWMDVWRYSDWYGRRMVPDVWNSAPQIWRWRDWIVRSLNSDKGYDRMLIEMLAADEVDPTNDEAVCATGFLIRNWYALNPNDWMRSNVEHTGKAFLGLTFNCAHCHDHKYDPITQEDYFRMRAFFEPIGARQDRLAGEPDPGPFQEYSYSVLRKIVRTGAVRIYDKSPEAPTWFYSGGDERNRISDRGSIAPGVPAFLSSSPIRIDSIALPAGSWYPGLRPAIQETILSERRSAIGNTQKQLFEASAVAADELPALRKKLAAVESEQAQAVSSAVGAESLQAIAQKIEAARRAVEVFELKVKALKARLVAEAAELASAESRINADRARYGSEASDQANLVRAASHAEREAAVRTAEAELLTKEQALAAALTKPADATAQSKAIESANMQLAAARTALDTAKTALSDRNRDATYTPLSPVYPETSTGRRRALGEWIASRNNPLTPRVAANHIWMRHFHAPLVASVYDFGRNGSPPTHPALLDWLAVEFMDAGWSMKHLHRLIVTSNTYRMASGAGPITDARAAADPENKWLWRMNVGRMEAEVVRDSLLYSAARLDTRMGGQELENNQALTTYRRTLYYSCNPELDGMSQFGALFDAPEPTECYRRTRSVIPQQALALANGELIHDLSDSLASALWSSLAPGDQSCTAPFVIAAFEQIMSRAPTAAELEKCVAFLTPQGDAENLEIGAARLRAGLVRALFNHNDFLAIR